MFAWTTLFQYIITWDLFWFTYFDSYVLSVQWSCWQAGSVFHVIYLHPLVTGTFLLFFFPPFHKYLLASYLFFRYLFARHWRKKQIWINHCLWVYESETNLNKPWVLWRLCPSLPLQPHLNTFLLALDRLKDVQFSKYTTSSHLWGFQLFPVSKNALPFLLLFGPPSNFYLTNQHLLNPSGLSLHDNFSRSLPLSPEWGALFMCSLVPFLALHFQNGVIIACLFICVCRWNLLSISTDMCFWCALGESWAWLALGT